MNIYTFNDHYLKPTLGCGGVVILHTSPPCWFSLNNSETVKDLILAFRSKFSDIGENSEEGISDFRISCQSLNKENCHKTRISDDIDMKLGPITKLYK